METISYQDGSLIVVEQLPVIKERLAMLGSVIDEQISEALALECTADTVKQIKVMRASLNNQFSELEDRRKTVKKAVMEPYNQFESSYKEYISDKYKDADAQLKAKVDGVESELKQKKYSDIKTYFDEYRLSRHVDFVSMDTWKPNITLAITPTALKKEAKAYINRICDDLALIETQEHKAEIMVEYRRSLNVSQAITAVTERRKALEEQLRRQEEVKAREAAETELLSRQKAAAPASFAPPVIQKEPEKRYTVAFSICETKDTIAGLVQYMRANKIAFEQIPLENIIKNDKEDRTA